MTYTPAPRPFIERGPHVHAMQWDGTRASIDAICAWANANVDPLVDDNVVQFNFTGPTDAQDVTALGVDMSYLGVDPGDWLFIPQDQEPVDGLEILDDEDFTGRYAPVIAPAGASSRSTGAEDEFRDVVEEMAAQDSKWGAGRHLPDGTGGPNDEQRAGLAKLETDRAARDGRLTWRQILAEEILEAFAETDRVRLRGELVQAEAVIRQWIRDIDSRTTPVGHDGADQ